jgi:NTE family protein
MITKLVIEGAGLPGFAYLGALHELEANSLLHHVKYFAGASSGAIFATLLALNCSVDVIINFFGQQDVSTVIPNYWMVRRVWNLVRHWGAYPTTRIKAELQKLMPNPDVTFGELYEQMGNYLVIVVSCVNTMSPVYLNPVTHKDVKIIDGLLASISIPMFFRATEYNFDSNLYYYVDGGVMDNFPIWIFNDLELLESGCWIEIDRTYVSNDTLGLKILSTHEEHTKSVHKGNQKPSSALSYLYLLIMGIILQVERLTISDTYLERTIAIPTSGVDMVEFSITNEQKNALFEDGQNAVRQFLDRTPEVSKDCLLDIDL